MFFLSLSGIPLYSVGHLNSRGCSRACREWRWDESQGRVWASFPISVIISLPSLLRVSKIPHHPAGSVGTEILEQQDKGYFCLINTLLLHNNNIWYTPVGLIYKDLQCLFVLFFLNLTNKERLFIYFYFWTPLKFKITERKQIYVYNSYEGASCVICNC